VFGADSSPLTPGSHSNDTPVAGRFIDPIDNALAECSGALRRTHKGSARMVALLSLATALSALAHVQDVTRGYQNGWQCAQGSGCLGMPTLTDCFLCCGQYCWGGSLLSECQKACMGVPPPNGSGVTVQAIAVLADSIRSHRLEGNDLIAAVSTIELAMHHPDEHVAMAARAIGGETPLVNINQ
jgi:hypothetical protein